MSTGGEEFFITGILYVVGLKSQPGKWKLSQIIVQLNVLNKCVSHDSIYQL